MRVLVTGATGFVGRRTCAALLRRGHEVSAALRDPASASRLAAGVRGVVVGDLAEAPAWDGALAGADAVIHLAARVHVMDDRRDDAEALYHRLNVDASLALAAAAASQGVRRLVYVSSVKAVAEASERPLTEHAAPAPQDAYGRSKLAAERALRAAGRDGTLEVTIVRPPLVYGPGVGGNFVRLLGLARLARRLPLPLGGVRNRRSLVYVENLADALVTAVEQPRAAGETYFVTDGEDLSTTELLRRLGAAFGGTSMLVPVPSYVLGAAARLLGRGAEADRLLGSLRVDGGHIRDRLGWAPPATVDEGLRATAAWYLARGGAT